ncbi:50S ribosome-binding GTPase [Candidatus Woesearchaeota archaeon]|nr:50S ribosome-binding GTPase [Candidatus Woesearchaeota archaeon]
MAFQDIPPIKKPQEYIETAFNRAAKNANALRSHIRGEKLVKSKRLEEVRLTTIKDVLLKHLNKIITTFPSIDSMQEFYKQLVKNDLDYALLKKSLGGVNWAKSKVITFCNKYLSSIRKCRDVGKISQYGKEYYGRIASVIKQIKKELAYLEEARKVMRNFPSIKEIFTACIAGFPNVGKSTLLSKLSTAKPEIKEYSFTTKSLNLGYFVEDKKKVQLIDTPGTLNRFEKMNAIEQRAYLAMKHCADLIIYIFDLTEPYPIQEQKKLLTNLKKLDKPIVVYLSKTDILDKKIIEKFKIKEKILDIKKLKSFLIKKV